MNIMVQIFKETLLTSLILFLMTACSDDKKELKIIVEPTSFHFEQTGGSKKFGITPNEPATFQKFGSMVQSNLGKQHSRTGNL